MPTIKRVQFPDGSIHRVEVPDGATNEQIIAFVSSQHPQAAPAAASPASAPSNLERLIRGQPQQRTLGQDVGRQLGLTARYALSGPLEFAGIFTDPIAERIGLGTARQGAQYLGDKLGLPNPEGKGERVVGEVSKALSGGAGWLKGAQVASGLPGVAGMVGNAAQAQPVAQALSNIGGSGASSYAREEGASPGVQVAAGLLGGLTPGASAYMGGQGARLLARGGEAGRQNMVENIQTFGRAGTQPSIGQASESRASRGVESLLSSTPGGAGPMARTAERQAAQIGAKVDSVASGLSPRASGEQAGRGIERGVQSFMDDFGKTSTRLYGEVDRLVPPQMPVSAANTQAYLASAASSVPGAKNVSALLSNPKLAAIRDGLEADLQAGSLPYDALKQLRSKVGEMMGDAGLLADIPTKQLRKLYGALSEDMKVAVQQTGDPRAMAAFQRANNHFRAAYGDGGRVDVLAHVIERNGGPEKVFSAALSGTREGATTLRAVTQSLPQDGRKLLAAAVIRRLGKATPGKQDETGAVFSTETFLTNWSSMAPEAKSALFARLGPKFNADMDAIAKVAANTRAGSKVFANPAGTGGKVAQTGAATSFGVALVTGHLLAATAVAGGVGGANVMARAMTNPRIVAWLAMQTKLPAAAFVQQLAALRGSTDPEVAEFARALGKAYQENDQAAHADRH